MSRHEENKFFLEFYCFLRRVGFDVKNTREIIDKLIARTGRDYRRTEGFDVVSELLWNEVNRAGKE